MPTPHQQTWGPEEGLEPRFDCPDCSYARTGMTVSRHAFKRHLYTEHGYTVDEATRLSTGAE